jgi:RHS repeat-associated protein
MFFPLFFFALVSCSSAFGAEAPEETLLSTEEASRDVSIEPVSLVDMTGVPSSFVNRSVSAITGDFINTDEEARVGSVDPYILGHVYVSSDQEKGNIGHGWDFQHNHLLKVYQPKGIRYTGERAKGPVPPESDYTHLYLYDAHFGKILLRGNSKAKHFKPVLKKTGYTNVSGGEISGRGNVKNICAWWVASRDEWHVRMPDGSRRVYERRFRQQDTRIPGHYSYYFRDYHITKELHASGNVTYYTYNSMYKIQEIKTLSSDEQDVLHWVRFDYEWHKNVRVRTSDGMEYTYTLEPYSGLDSDEQRLLTSIESPGEVEQKIEYKEKTSFHEARANKIGRPGGNYLETYYWHSEGASKLDGVGWQFNEKDRKFMAGRVRCQRAPFGPGGEAVTTHTYLYCKKGKDDYSQTSVRDALGNVTLYDYNERNRLVRVTKKDHDTVLMKQCFFWGKKSEDEEGDLVARTLFDEEGRCILARTYEYDDNHNVTRETYFGNFYKDKPFTIALTADGYPQEGSDCDRKEYRYTYSTDNFNLKLSECDPEGNNILYEYKSGTNLLSARFTCEGREVRKREFFSYDSGGFCIESVCDDGTSKNREDLQGVTERHIKRFTIRKKLPHYGAMNEICELYLDPVTKKEVLLQKTVNSFNDKGLVIRKTIFDAKNSPISVYEYAYDTVGRLIWSRDPEGGEQFLSYDRFGHIASKKGPRIDFEVRYEYDMAGRCIKEEEVIGKDTKLAVRYRYDVLGRKIGKIDPQGNETRFTYDGLDRITSITFPDTHDPDGHTRSAERRFSYAMLGRQVWTNDERGYVEKKVYSSNSKLLSCQAFDDSVRQYHYDRLERNVEEICPNGLCITREYDFLGRKRCEREQKNGYVFSQKNWRYNLFHLLEEEAPRGLKTFFTYDGAGRKTLSFQPEDEKGARGRRTSFLWDAAGRLREERREGKGGTYVARVFRYDHMGRVIWEALQDERGVISEEKKSGYDPHGNITLRISTIDGKEAKEETLWSPHKTPLRLIDPLGHETRIEYDYFHPNGYGQYVIQKVTIDPAGIRYIEEQNARGMVIRAQKIDSLGALLAKSECYYDSAQNLIREEGFTLANSGPSLFAYTFRYGPANRLEEAAIAEGSQDERVTKYLYNSFGQKESELHNDGASIYHEYDEKGRLARLYDSVHTIDYRFCYDAADRCVSASNVLLGTSTKRTFTIFGDCSAETLENGLWMGYQYDEFGRMKRVMAPDATTIRYSYEGAYLKTIERASRTGALLARTVVKEREESGRARTVVLPGECGEVHFAYDSLGRRVGVTSNTFSETIPSDGFDSSGNLLRMTREDPLSRLHSAFGYDSLHQLISENGVQNHTYGYNALFARLIKDGASYTVNGDLSPGSWSNEQFQYTKSGARASVTKEGRTTQYEYDSLDRLTAVDDGKVRYEYSYDAFSRRMKKKIVSKTENRVSIERNYLYMSDCEIGSAERDGTITEFRTLGEGLGAEIGAACVIELGGKVYVPIHDLRGNLALLLTDKGDLSLLARYSAFGEEELYDANLTARDGSLCPWRFSSKRVDDETGFVFFGRRYYDPEHGLWISPDPIGFKAGPNLLAYLQNNPLNRIDLFGLEDESPASGHDSGSNIVERAVEFIRDCFFGAADFFVSHCTPFEHSWAHISNPVREFLGAEAYHPSHSSSYTIPSRDGNDSTGTLVVTNGICTSFNTARGYVANLIEQYAGVSGGAAYNATHGVFLDLMEAILNWLGVETHPVKMEVRTWRGSLGTNSTLVAVLFSQGGLLGGLALQHLTPEEKLRMHVVTLGSAKIISRKDGVASAKNFIGKTDFVPLFGSPLRYLDAVLFGNDEVEFVGSFFSLPFSQHAFEGSDYQTALKDYLGDNFNLVPK